MTCFAPAVAAYKKSGVALPLLIVGVGYGGSFSKPVNKPRRATTRRCGRTTNLPAVGAAKFRAFLEKTLGPSWRGVTRFAMTSAGLMGYSLGSLLVLDAPVPAGNLSSRHHLAGSPSIWWGEAAILTQVAALHVQQPDVPGRLFLSVGEKDSESMTGDLAPA